MSKPIVQPLTDIIETKKSFLIRTDVPGVDEQSVDLTVDQNTLTIKATMSEELFERKDYKSLFQEFDAGDYQRSFQISSEIDQDGISANLHAGVLEITLPKAKQAQPRQIKVGN